MTELVVLTKDVDTAQRLAQGCCTLDLLDKPTHIQTHTQTHTHMDMQTHRHRHRHTDTHMDRDKNLASETIV